MGMYDTINGEQVKCFTWVSLYNNSIDYHGGDLKYYSTSDEVPYKQPHYNYGKNFVILDYNRFPESEYCDYDYILHVIIDGKVKNTYHDELGEIDWSVIENVVGYTGELLNVHNDGDIIDFINTQRELWEQREKIRSHHNELFKESMKYYTGIGLLDKESEERKMRHKKLDELFKLMDEEEKRIKPELDKLYKENSKWFIYEDDDLIKLGDFISVYYRNSPHKDHSKEVIINSLKTDETLYDRYVKWQGSDEFIKEFRGYKDENLDR